jgi:hypothetical protein
MSDQIDARSMQGSRSTFSRYWVQRREWVQARNRPFSPGSSTGAIGQHLPVNAAAQIADKRTLRIVAIDCALARSSGECHVEVTFGKARRDDFTPGARSSSAGRTAIRAAAMLASWCGCEVFDFVVLAADAIEQLPAVGHPTKVSRSKWPLGKADVAGAGPSCPSGGATE